MKKLVALLLTLSVLLFTSIKSVSAEEVEDIPTSSPSTGEVIEDEEINDEEIIENEDVDITIEDEIQPSDMQAWFEENLGWVVGIPTGMITTIISIALFIHKTKKKFDELNEDTNAQNKNSKEHLKAAVELVVETKKQSEFINKKVDSFIENNASQIAALTNALEKMTKAYEESTTKIAALEEVIGMMATHTKELVANGTAEEIVKKIRG